MHDELNLSPFERSHTGPHGAFIVRFNRAHAEEACRRVLERRLAEVSFEVGGPAPMLVRKAA